MPHLIRIVQPPVQQCLKINGIQKSTCLWMHHRCAELSNDKPGTGRDFANEIRVVILERPPCRRSCIGVSLPPWDLLIDHLAGGLSPQNSYAASQALDYFFAGCTAVHSLTSPTDFNEPGRVGKRIPSSIFGDIFSAQRRGWRRTRLA